MAADLIAIGTGAANSVDIVVTSTPVTVGIKDAAGPNLIIGCEVDIFLKADSGEYFLIGGLRSTQLNPVVVLSGPGTYRLSRTANSAACGAYSA